jgi:hypothetical protein
MIGVAEMGDRRRPSLADAFVEFDFVAVEGMPSRTGGAGSPKSSSFRILGDKARREVFKDEEPRAGQS